MSSNRFPSDVQFAGLIQAATAAADAHAQERVGTVLGKRQRGSDENVIDTQLRDNPNGQLATNSQLPATTPVLQSSASVLFREPTAKGGKHSRPALATVYRGLELAPESYVRLQSAAKAYMLDQEHMERRDVVGQKKHSTDNHIAKVRLWECVENFLNTDNNGGNWFGNKAGNEDPNAPPRTIFWPDDKDKVIKACLPLFRKTVTNERQRMYALQVRKPGSTKVAKNQKNDATPQSEGTPQMQATTQQSPVIDLTLDNVEEQVIPSSNDNQQDDGLPASLKLHVNVVHNVDGTRQRAIPRFSMNASPTPTLAALLEEARTRYDVCQFSVDANWDEAVVKVWLPGGLVQVRDDHQWLTSIIGGSMVDWMDLEIRVLIDIGEQDLLAID